MAFIISIHIIIRRHLINIGTGPCIEHNVIEYHITDVPHILLDYIDMTKDDFNSIYKKHQALVKFPTKIDVTPTDEERLTTDLIKNLLIHTIVHPIDVYKNML